MLKEVIVFMIIYTKVFFVNVKSDRVCLFLYLNNTIWFCKNIGGAWGNIREVCTTRGCKTDSEKRVYVGNIYVKVSILWSMWNVRDPKSDGPISDTGLIRFVR